MLLMFHQALPHMICQNRIVQKKGGTHRDPRCSLECFHNWAEREANLLVWQLKKVQLGRIYFGNVQIQGNLLQEDHLDVRRRLLTHLKKWNTSGSNRVRFRANSEIGANGRIHYHYCIYADYIFDCRDAKRLWDTACHPWKAVVKHDSPQKGIVAASKYMFKALMRVRERKTQIYLFHPRSIRITWGTRDFFTPSRKIVLDEWRRSWSRQ